MISSAIVSQKSPVTWNSGRSCFQTRSYIAAYSNVASFPSSCSQLADGNTVVSCRSFASRGVQKRVAVGKTHFSSGITTYDESLGEATSLVAEEKIGVLLLNLGGPDTLHDVQPFLFNLFADPDIIRLPRLFQFLQRPLAQLISVLRAPKSKEGYAAIGGGSPLRKITDEQAQALKMALGAKNKNVNVYVGMRYWYPFTEEAIDQIKRDRITKLVVLPLYPQYSISTTGSSLRVLQNIFREDPYLSKLSVAIIRSWYQREGYIKSMADLIEKELQSFAQPDEVMIFFSAHGVPVSYVEEAGDPYRDQMEDCIFLIMKELKVRGINNDHKLAYQSRVGPVQWLKPYTDEVLVELGQKGVKSLVAVPVSCSLGIIALNVEGTLYDVYNGVTRSKISAGCINAVMMSVKYEMTRLYGSYISESQRAFGEIASGAVLEIKKAIKLPDDCCFVSEHIETLEEIDMEYRELALESGIKNWGRVPALNCTSSFITDLADAVVEALPSAESIIPSTSTPEETDQDPFNYLVKMFFGSFLAFILLFSPKMISAFKSNIL